MTRQQRTRRYTWGGALAALAFYTGLMIAIAIGGEITAEQPATAPVQSR
ncbi:hypothetical protein [Metapseudomonas otitidis]|nr:hypothetical protein [Pseudomonas otitidis]MBO2926683.1 hypothetical protein [Pseudomonas otitidis]